VFLSGQAQREKLEFEKTLQADKAREASDKYHKQGEPREGDHRADLTQVCQI